MTSNQLAYAANQIQQQIADEAARHNAENEGENKRHNTAMETLTAKEQELTERRDNETARHNQAMEDIQKQYNDLYLRIQKAQGDEKLRLQAQAQEIDALKAKEIERHNKELEGLQGLATEIESQKADEIARHNKAGEAVNATLANLKEREVQLQAKRDYNQSMYWSGALANETLKINNEFSLGTQRNWIDLYNTRANINLTNQKIKESQSVVNLNTVRAATEGIKTALQGADTVTGGIGRLFNLMKP